MSPSPELQSWQQQQQQQQREPNSMFHEGDLVDFEGKQFFFLDLDIIF